MLTTAARVVWPSVCLLDSVVRGYAWSGGGHSITRVDVTADGGQSWVVAEWLHKPRQAEGRVWAWTLWQARVPLSEEAQHTGRSNYCLADG